MTLLQSAIFDTDEMAAAIAAWKARSDADFEPLGRRRRRRRRRQGA